MIVASFIRGAAITVLRPGRLAVVTYCEQAPPSGLAPWVQCTWQRSGDGGPPVRVVPDGCIDIVWTEGAGTQIVGPNTRAFVVPLAAGTRVAGVRLHPGAAPDPLVAAAVTRLDDRGLSVATLAFDLGVSERQLRRRFQTAVGYGPKLLQRVLRLSRALDAARAGDTQLARVAVEAGYADQAHFTHDCRDLAGVAPSALL